MKKLPLILSALFVGITLSRIASLASGPLKSGILGWVFAIGLGLSVYVSAYWIRYSTTRKIAIGALILFISIDGFLNLTEVLWQLYPEDLIVVFCIRLSAWVYGIFPTISLALFGYMQSQISKLPSKQENKGSELSRLYVLFLSFLKNKLVARMTDGGKNLQSMTIQEIMSAYGVSQRTAYRWKEQKVMGD